MSPCHQMWTSWRGSHWLRLISPVNSVAVRQFPSRPRPRRDNSSTNTDRMWAPVGAGEPLRRKLIGRGPSPGSDSSSLSVLGIGIMAPINLEPHSGQPHCHTHTHTYRMTDARLTLHACTSIHHTRHTHTVGCPPLWGTPQICFFSFFLSPPSSSVLFFLFSSSLQLCSFPSASVSSLLLMPFSLLFFLFSDVNW